MNKNSVAAFKSIVFSLPQVLIPLILESLHVAFQRLKHYLFIFLLVLFTLFLFVSATQPLLEILLKIS